MFAWLRSFLRWLLIPYEDRNVDLETEDNNLYKRDLLQCMQAIDDFESGICRMINSEFVAMIKRIGLIVYSAGPAISRSSVELIEPLVALYDTDNHGKDVKVAALMDLSTMMMLNIEHQERAADAELHMALLDDLEQYTYMIQEKQSSVGQSASTPTTRSGRSTRTSYMNHPNVHIGRSSALSTVASNYSHVFHEDAQNNNELLENRIFVSWIIYTTKAMCLGNPAVISEVTGAVDNKFALRNLLQEAGELVEWDKFLPSKENQADALIKILNLHGLDDIIECDSQHEDQQVVTEDVFREPRESEKRLSELSLKLSSKGLRGPASLALPKGL